MPWRTSASSSTLTVAMFSTPQAFRIWMARPEKPHCGNWAVPFMNSTTGALLTVSRIQFCTSWVICSLGFLVGYPPFYLKALDIAFPWVSISSVVIAICDTTINDIHGVGNGRQAGPQVRPHGRVERHQTGSLAGGAGGCGSAPGAGLVV